MAVSAPVKPTLQTAADLERLSALGYRYELVRGELREMVRPGGIEGSSISRLSVFVGIIVIDQDLGETFAAETGFLVGRDPDTVLAPDCAFVAKGRIPSPVPNGFVKIVPDIVLKTRSPSNTKKQASAKVALWLELGVKLVWEMNPQTRVLTVNQQNQMPRFLGENDTLNGGDVLPDLSVPIARLFL